jgi:hypothetical protein
VGTISIKSNPSGGGIIGRIFATIFFGIFAFVGVMIAISMQRDRGKADATSLWNVTPCTIAESTYVLPRSSSDGYRAKIHYRYTIDGNEISSERFSLKDSGERDFEKIQRILLKYPPGAQTVCYVNPADVHDAILVPSSKSSIAIFLFPMIFVGIGVIGMTAMWARPTKQRSPTILSSHNKSSGRLARWGLIAFFSIFLLVGLALSVVMLRQAGTAFAAKNWPEVPATVVFSRVASHSGDDSTTYSVDVLYRYEYGGKTYLSNRYHVIGGSSSGYDGKARVVKEMSPGKRIMAHVNPRDPVIAILVTGFTWDLLFVLIPLVFVLVGAGGIIGTLWFASRGRSTAPSSVAAAAAQSPQLSGGSSRRGKFIGLSIFTLVWNGLTWTFVILVTHDGGIKANLCFLSFLSIFIIIGLGTLFLAGQSFLQLFNPTVQLALSRTPLHLGDNVIVKWELAGRYDRVQRLTIVLEGRESARYRRGTDTHTDTKVFFRQTIADAAKQVEIVKGQKPLSIPATTMHTFDSSDNHIEWKIVVKGEIPNWPDINDEMKLAILPLPLGEIKPEVQS